MFETEAQLAAPVEEWLTSVGSSCIAREVEVGFGVPDLVAGVGDRQALRNRRRQAAPITETVQLSLLEFCRTARSEDELRRWAPHGYSSLLRRAITPLVERGLLSVRGGSARARSHPKDPFEHLIAVELKLSDVRRGLAQAYAYRAFAEVSYLALPAQRLSQESMQRARHIGVGLLAIHAGTVEEAVEPPGRSLATPGRRRMASEQTLEASLHSSTRQAGSPRSNMLRVS